MWQQFAIVSVKSWCRSSISFSPRPLLSFSGSCKLNRIIDSPLDEVRPLSFLQFYWLLATRPLPRKGGVFDYLPIKTLRRISLCYWVRSNSFSWRVSFQSIVWFAYFSFLSIWLISGMLENRCLISAAVLAFPLFLREASSLRPCGHYTTGILN